jgi:uncharacterized protein (TIGR03084 family)
MTDEQRALEAQVADLRAEGRDLDALLATLAPDDWSRATSFKRWTVWDVVAHLHFSDHMGMTSLRGEDAFRELMRNVGKARLPMAQFAREWLGAISGAALRERWRTLLASLCDSLAAAEPERRLAWAGPGMRPRMFATARQMETWAHGSEIYDLLGARRVESDRLKNVAAIGVRTFGWTFANRKIGPPGPAPHVQLVAPSGAAWTWNDPQPDNVVAGSALEFCQVVTQVRNVADTRLTVVGEPARQWMAIAQCFAGPPEDPPPPGSRVPARAQR